MTDNTIMTQNHTTLSKYTVTYKGVKYTFDLQEQNEFTQKFAIYRKDTFMFYVLLNRQSDEDELQQLEDTLADYLEEYCDIIRG